VEPDPHYRAHFPGPAAGGYFPRATLVPKTLVFAKDDSHAEESCAHAAKSSAKGMSSARRSLNKTSGRPEDLIANFRNKLLPALAVDVDMIATATDIRPLEILLSCGRVLRACCTEQISARHAC